MTALRGSLDFAAGPMASQLDQLYDFVLRRLQSGNARKEPRPTEEALQVLRGLLEAWQDLASRPASELVNDPSPFPVRSPASPVRASAPASAYAQASLYTGMGGRR